MRQSMAVLVVIAHPEKTSFTHSWANESIKAAKMLGHQVLISDIYQMGFDPIEKAVHYNKTYPENQFDILKTQEFHSRQNTLPADIEEEIFKFRECELAIFHFPIWWFAPPAALRGRMERVLVNGRMHDTHNRFDKGLFKGKRAQFCVTMGASGQESSHNGKEGDINMLLWPMAYTLRYIGMDILPYKILNSVHSYHSDKHKKGLEKYLSREIKKQKSLIQNFQNKEVLKFNSDADFNEEGQLKENAKSYSPFIRPKP